jgi:hypothetical protein
LDNYRESGLIFFNYPTYPVHIRQDSKNYPTYRVSSWIAKRLYPLHPFKELKVGNIYAQVSGLPQGGVSGVPTGFDSYLLPLGEEFDNNMSPRVGNLRNLISHFSS